MVPNELAIGDFIKFQGEIYIVEEISAQGWIHLIYPKGRRLNVTSDYIMHLLEPIPLTPEILELNGFQKVPTAPHSYSNSDLWDCDIIINISEDTYEDTWHVYKFTDHNDNTFVCFSLCYVHELQHLLKLCNLNNLANSLKVE